MNHTWEDDPDFLSVLCNYEKSCYSEKAAFTLNDLFSLLLPFAKTVASELFKVHLSLNALLS